MTPTRSISSAPFARTIAPTRRSAICSSKLSRRNDLDGRGNLSEEALAEFTQFFLETCLDQVRFMEELLQPQKLRVRIKLWAEEEITLGSLPPKAGAVLEALLYRGVLPRGEVADALGVSARTARRIVAALADHGALTSDTPKGDLRVTFPARLASRWMPGLLPEAPT